MTTEQAHNPETTPENEAQTPPSSDKQWAQSVGSAVSNEAALKEEVATLKDQLLRALAETENIRRRSDRMVEDATKFSVTSFAKNLIDVLENLHRAIEAIPADQMDAHPLIKTLLEGVEMTRRELLNVFDKHGIKRIAPEVGGSFDHNLHQAVAHIPTNDHEPGAVVQVLQAGYMLHDRLLRPAMVGVAKAAADQPASTAPKE